MMNLAAVLVRDADASDVGPEPVGEVEAPEAHRAVADVQLGEAAARQFDADVALHPGCEGAACALSHDFSRQRPSGITHRVQAFVSPVEVSLL